MSSCFSRCLRVPIAIRAFYEAYLWILQTLLLTHPDLHPGLLGDSAENPRFIETLPKRGYRFIGDVSVVDADTRPKRPGSADGDLRDSERKSPEREKESGHQVQDAGLIVAPVGPKGRPLPT